MKDGRATTNPGVGNPNIVAPIGQPDEDVQIVRLPREGAPEILIVNFQTHPDVISGCKISADWPGFTRRTLEGALGADVRCVFFNGAQGDSNHINVHPAPGRETNKRYAHAQQMGRMVAGSVLREYGFCQPAPAGTIRCAVKDVPMPIRARTADELPAARADWALYQAGRKKEIKGIDSGSWRRHASSVSKRSRTRFPSPSRPLPWATRSASRVCHANRSPNWGAR